MVTPNVTPEEIYGTPLSRLIEQLWDACGEFMAQRRALVRKGGHHDAIKALMPAGNVADAGLSRAVAADLTMPRFIYVNQRQWEDQPPELVEFVHLMGLRVRTSRFVPPDSAHLTRDEFPADEVGKALLRGQKLPRFA